ncbi:MAG: lipoate--protein ligase family protein [Deltaproteobacteria bacterium]|nr:lipoate--protein ligase family protein [Deltaproteobacteria bacterium]MBW2394343.1 lipoate--protein ligase family protein [Deltaproteobacteria bacterium]
MSEPLDLLQARFPGRPAFDTAISRALLTRVASGERRESLRLYVPDDVVAFSVLDRTRPGFDEAVSAARAEGFEAVLRLAGGRAALFTRQCLAFAWCVPAADARKGIAARFEQLAALVRDTFSDLGVDARVGAVPGEYCPGDHSVNARGVKKLMGVGQRVVKGAAHVGGVIVVGNGAQVGRVLEPVYRAMGVDMDPLAAGAVSDEVPGLTVEHVADALLARFAQERSLVPAEVGVALTALAEEFEPEHQLAGQVRV